MTSIRMQQTRRRTSRRMRSSTCENRCCGRYGSPISGTFILVSGCFRNSFTVHSKSYYLQQVHQPRHLHESARLFGPDILEMCTRTEWWVVPMIWGPITVYLFLRSMFQFTAPLPNFFSNASLPVSYIGLVPGDAIAKTLGCFFVGNVIWTILEYVMHRFLFHIDEFLPDTPTFILLHFLMHGIHHYLPMDRYAFRSVARDSHLTLFLISLRLVMPPTLFFVLQLPFTQLAYALFPVAVANGIIAGAFTFC